MAIHEVLEVHKCIDEQKIESSIISHGKSLEVVKIMDELREDWGLNYPME